MLGRIAAVAAIAAGGVLLSKRMKGRSRSGSGSFVETGIDVEVPVSTAYNQWTQFEEFPQFMHSVHEVRQFPRFMEGVQEVRQLDDTHLHWRASVAGQEKEWEAEITEQIPDQRIAWRSTSGAVNAGVVTFEKLSENSTKVTLRMSYDPETPREKLGDALGAMKLEAKGNLKRFKELIESRGVESGAWRGTVPEH